MLFKVPYNVLVLLAGVAFDACLPGTNDDLKTIFEDNNLKLN